MKYFYSICVVLFLLCFLKGEPLVAHEAISFETKPQSELMLKFETKEVKGGKGKEELESKVKGVGAGVVVVDTKSKESSESAKNVERAEMKTIDQIVKGYAYKIKKEKNITLISAKGSNKKKIESIELLFDSHYLVETKEARRLLVYLVENFLSHVNAFAKDHPQLSSTPLTIENLEAKMTFSNFFGEYVDSRYMWQVELDDSEVLYQAFNCNDETINCSSLKETYSQSLYWLKLEGAEAKEDSNPIFSLSLSVDQKK